MGPTEKEGPRTQGSQGRSQNAPFPSIPHDTFRSSSPKVPGSPPGLEPSPVASAAPGPRRQLWSRSALLLSSRAGAELLNPRGSLLLNYQVRTIMSLPTLPPSKGGCGGDEDQRQHVWEELLEHHPESKGRCQGRCDGVDPPAAGCSLSHQLLTHTAFANCWGSGLRAAGEHRTEVRQRPSENQTQNSVLLPPAPLSSAWELLTPPWPW